jgi:hypothetical protein
VITGALLFALFGLFSGFALGVFTRIQQAQSSAATDKVLAHATPLQNAAPATPTTRPLGCPAVQTNRSQQKADGRTLYRANVQAEGKYQNQTCNLSGGKQQPIHDKGITCRLWLMKDTHNPLKLPQDLIRGMQLTGPFPDEAEIPNGLIFVGTTQQTQQCQEGLGTWQYLISPSVESGAYYLMGLTVWEGRNYNWSWAKIVIANAKDHGKQEKKED